MRNTYWFAVDYNGTGHLFACPPERDTGMWTGEEALYIPKGQFGEMFPRITWQDVPVVVTLECFPAWKPGGCVLSSAASIFCGGIPAGISQRIWRIHNNSP